MCPLTLSTWRVEFESEAVSEATTIRLYSLLLSRSRDEETEISPTYTHTHHHAMADT